MATLSAQASYDGAGLVSVMLSDTIGVTGITRTDANGINPVRLPNVQLGTTASLTVIDHEAALSGDIMYRLDGQHSDAWTKASGLSLPRFTLPFVPQFSVTVQSVTEYDAERTSRAVFHDVIGRPDPMVAAARMSTRRGNLTARFKEYTEARDLQVALDRGQPVMYRQTEHPGQDMYFHAERVRLSALPADDAWELEISYREIARPPGRIHTSPTWTFDAMKTQNTTFGALPQKYTTFYDLAIGREGK